MLQLIVWYDSSFACGNASNEKNVCAVPSWIDRWWRNCWASCTSRAKGGDWYLFLLFEEYLTSGFGNKWLVLVVSRHECSLRYCCRMLFTLMLKAGLLNRQCISSSPDSVQPWSLETNLKIWIFVQDTQELQEKLLWSVILTQEWRTVTCKWVLLFKMGSLSILASKLPRRHHLCSSLKRENLVRNSLYGWTSSNLQHVPSIICQFVTVTLTLIH